MKLRYDETADALYIKFAEGVAVARTEQCDAGTLIDVDRHGSLVGIELIRPARAWPLDEIVARFNVADDDAEVLRSLWPGDGEYPYSNRRAEPLVA